MRLKMKDPPNTPLEMFHLLFILVDIDGFGGGGSANFEDTKSSRLVLQTVEHINATQITYISYANAYVRVYEYVNVNCKCICISMCVILRKNTSQLPELLIDNIEKGDRSRCHIVDLNRAKYTFKCLHDSSRKNTIHHHTFIMFSHSVSNWWYPSEKHLPNSIMSSSFRGNNLCVYIYMGVSKNRGTPKSSILIGLSLINHPFWGTSIFGNTHIYTHVSLFFNVTHLVTVYSLSS